MAIPFPSFKNSEDRLVRVLQTSEDTGSYFKSNSTVENILENGGSRLFTLSVPAEIFKLETLNIATGSCSKFDVKVFERSTTLPEDLVYLQSNLNGENGRVVLSCDTVFSNKALQEQVYILIVNNSSSASDFSIELKGNK